MRTHKGLTSLLALIGVAVLAVIIGLLPRVTARADPSVPTHAVVDPSTVPPRIECKWELPDVDSATPGIQYGLDDDPTLTPGYPCALPTSGGPPTMPDQVHHMIQVRPNLEDLPEQRRIQLWMAVDHPLGISAITDVFWQVYHPDGTLKLQVHGTQVPPSSPACSAWGPMFDAAIRNGELTSAAVNDVNYGMVAKCLQDEKAFYYAEFPLSKEQMCGEYKIVATAVGVGGTTTSLTNYIDVLCVFAIDIDFNRVDWGNIFPGLTKWVSGDLIWDVPPDNRPTVKNIGNDGMAVKIQFSVMTGTNFGKVIEQFDGKFGRSPSTLASIDPLPANTWGDFGTGTNQVLCANEIGKLDLSIHPPSVLPGDTYTGRFAIAGYAVTGLCKGSVHP